MSRLELLDAIVEYGERNHDDWAGLWLHGEVAFAAFTADLDAHRSRVEELADDAVVRVVSARHSLSELRAVMDEISERYSASSSILSVGIDPSANSVHVGVRPVALETAAELKERWGTLVTVVPQSSPGRAVSPATSRSA